MIDYYSEEKSGYVYYYILLEYCGSMSYLILDGTLIEAIQRLRNEKNLFTEGQTWKILYHTSIGLKFIHGKKYCHRGIRAENIMITMDNQFKIYDFSSGTSKFYETINNNVFRL
jgi:serine/threonine protein kinase